MKKSNKRDNRLIKANRIIKLIKSKGIARVSEEAIGELNDFFYLEAEKIAQALKERLTIKGKKTAGKEEVIEVLKEFEKTGKESFDI